MTYPQRYQRFRSSRITAWTPKIAAALQSMADTILKQPTIEAAIQHAHGNILPIDQLSSVIKSMYVDAGRIMGGYAYQEVRRQKRAQESKALMPLNLNQQLINDIISYYQTSLFNGAVIPISETLRDYILARLIEAQQQHLSITDVADAIEQAGFIRNRALMIARTETVKAANYGAKKGAQATGYAMNKVWVSAQQNRTRRLPRDSADHLHMNLVEAAMDEPFKVKDETGFIEMDRPGDSTAPARQVVNCRCHLSFRVL